MPDDAGGTGRKMRWRGLVWRLIAIAVVLAGYAAVKLLWQPSLSPSPDHTVVVPTLDCPMPKGRNVIWCASFQMAWNRLRDDVIKEPVRLGGAEDLCQRLNSAPQSEADLPPESYYAAAGHGEAIVETIRKEMAKRFPGAPAPNFFEKELGGPAVVAYAYMEARAKFGIPFPQNRKPLAFKDARGRETQVNSFGLRPEDIDTYQKVRDQVRVLFASRRYEKEDCVPLEFAVDPCKTSSPNQIVLARVEPAATLAGTLAQVEKLGAEFSKGDYPIHELEPADQLLIPDMRCEIAHSFTELERKTFLNPGSEMLIVTKAWQMIRFRLDRGGAELASEAEEQAACKPKYLLFRGPFLIYMKRRGARHPFFVMWVDNAELLSRWKQASSMSPQGENRGSGSLRQRMPSPSAGG